jgi:type III pantothenate kinase
MLKLILDVGNTNIKFGFFDNDKLIKTNIISTKSYSISQLRKNIKNISHTQIYIGSVVKHLNNQMLNDIKTITGISAKFINAKDFISEFDLSKFNINEIGVDILGLSLAIKYLYKKAIGISLGTATFAVAVDNSKLIGAVIAPSIELGINQLNETTALIKTKDFIN